MKSMKTMENNTGWFNINWCDRAAMKRGFLDHRDPSCLFRSRIFKMTARLSASEGVCKKGCWEYQRPPQSVARKQSRSWREALEGTGLDFALRGCELLELYRLATSLADPSKLSVGSQSWAPFLLWLSASLSSWPHSKSHGLAEERALSPKARALGMHGPVPSRQLIAWMFLPALISVTYPERNESIIWAVKIYYT